ncbi:hypothetical protein ACFVZD_20710 [Streptomyces sp. NPDC058287]|uniref:hypothetical protein n=1 Tax=Streptomyces TaxID=1883 RepID=UPI001D09BE2B|nr:hypothetical protein [Streptomyces longhuiensis]UDM03537.1 hypothetical protein LGI35_37485 [Streptomyces longhuiensis]
MNKKTTDLISEARTHADKLMNTKQKLHPDEAARTQALATLALAQSNVELVAALTRLTDAAVKPTGDIRKLIAGIGASLTKLTKP